MPRLTISQQDTNGSGTSISVNIPLDGAVLQELTPILLDFLRGEGFDTLVLYRTPSNEEATECHR